MFEIIGIAGITISMLAYVPQVIHLGKEHCSAGISRRAWAMWLVASLLVGILAVHRRDIVFIALQVSTMTAAPYSRTASSRVRWTHMMIDVRGLRVLQAGSHPSIVSRAVYAVNTAA